MSVSHSVDVNLARLARKAAKSGGPTWNGVNAVNSLGAELSISGAYLILAVPHRPPRSKTGVLFEHGGTDADLVVVQCRDSGPALAVLQDRCAPRRCR